MRFSSYVCCTQLNDFFFSKTPQCGGSQLRVADLSRMWKWKCWAEMLLPQRWNEQARQTSRDSGPTKVNLTEEADESQMASWQKLACWQLAEWKWECSEAPCLSWFAQKQAHSMDYGYCSQTLSLFIPTVQLQCPVHTIPAPPFQVRALCWWDCLLLIIRSDSTLLAL